MRIITRSILVLSLISLFTDVASEMLYPIMPIYLKSVGFSVLLIGILEGVAEATAGLSKGYFGKMSDNMGKRLPFVRLGYLLSALSKPMMAVFTVPAWIFSARTIDRIGKGIRTGARDAMLSDEATPTTKGRVFGFHRAMDTLGAVAGPALALLYLYYYPQQYKTLFYLATIPGIISISLTYLLRDKVAKPKEYRTKTNFRDFFQYWNKSPMRYRKVVAGLLLFALFNSSDVFLLLKVKDAGLSDVAVVGVYIFYNLVYALAAYPIGVLADRLGLKEILLAGLCVFALVYFGMAFFSGLNIYLLLFALYGLYAAATEGVAKAWISNISQKEDTGVAIGTYTGFQSISSMLASFIAGGIWMQAGSKATFVVTGFVSLLVVVYLLLATRNAAQTSTTGV